MACGSVASAQAVPASPAVIATPFVSPLASATPGGVLTTAPPSVVPYGDPYLWLEAQESARALSWVKAENAKTLSVLQRDTRFPKLFADALAIGEAKDRVPSPQFLNGSVFNFWRDATHVRGIWRKTTLANYASAVPTWQTVFDVDALAKREKKNWFWEGADCASPQHTRCLVYLSEGGEDAVTVREFDLATQAFVPGGFVLPRGKQNVAWADASSVLVSRAWKPGDLTASGYAFIVKKLARGAALSSAKEVFRGTKADVSAGPFAVRDGSGHLLLGVNRGVSFFESETQILTPRGLRKLAIPAKAGIDGMVAGKLLVEVKMPWQMNGRSFAPGSLVSMDLAAVLADPVHLKPTLVYAPGSRETLDSVAMLRDRVIVSINENVKGRAFVYTPGAGGWSRVRLPLADNSSVGVVSADRDGASAFVGVTSFLTPSTLFLANTATGSLAKIKSDTARFDASKLAVEQHFATSKDGTKIPYFLVHPKAMRMTGANPTILYAYGGFEVSLTPNYSGVLGKLWLERGGVYALANIRGGGEFGPAWHEAGLKTKRQRIYDDFAAVGRDLVTTKVTSARHLGIEGGSNGGLLMGVQFTQHPEMWNAVDIEVPLLDMLRFEKIDAGASWVGEYGSVSIPEQRAFLAKISPYNNLHADVIYPQPFIWTTTKDDRVGPQHARKFTARLAELGKPYLFYEVTEGGHGSGANIRESSFTSALAYTYFMQKLMK